MREKNWRYAAFLYRDGAGMERYLTQMASRGWYLKKTGAMLWTFQRGIPRETAYAVVYDDNDEACGGRMRRPGGSWWRRRSSTMKLHI